MERGKKNSSLRWFWLTLHCFLSFFRPAWSVEKVRRPLWCSLLEQHVYMYVTVKKKETCLKTRGWTSVLSVCVHSASCPKCKGTVWSEKHREESKTSTRRSFHAAQVSLFLQWQARPPKIDHQLQENTSSWIWYFMCVLDIFIRAFYFNLTG